MQKRNGQSGFHLALIPLVIVILGIIGFAGWYVYNANNKTETAPGSSAKIIDSVTTSPVPSPNANAVLVFDKELDGYKDKKLIGKNDNYEVYLLDYKDPYNNSSFIEGNILVYSVEKQKALKINKTIQVLNDGYTDIEQQDGNYLVIDYGTYVIRQKHILLLLEKDVISVSGVKKKMYYWKGNYIYTAADTKPYRESSSNPSLSIKYVNLKSKQVDLQLLNSQILVDYNAKSISSDELTYAQWTYEKESDAGIGNYTETTKTLDLTQAIN